MVLEPLDPARHAAALFASSKDAPELWKHLAYGPFANLDMFTTWLQDRAATDDPLFYALSTAPRARHVAWRATYAWNPNTG